MTRRSILAWPGTFIFLPVFAGILLLFDVAQRVARLFGQRPQEHVASALQVALVGAFRLCGTRLRVERAPGKDGPDYTRSIIRVGALGQMTKKVSACPAAIIRSPSSRMLQAARESLLWCAPQPQSHSRSESVRRSLSVPQALHILDEGKN